MNYWTTIITLLLFWLPSCAQTISSEDYRVYSAILEQDGAIKASRIVIIQELATSQESNAVNIALKENDLSTLNMMAHEFRFDSVSTATIHRYFTSPSIAEKFTDATAWPISVNLLSKQSFEKLFRHNAGRGWKLFYQRFPGAAGAFSFSKVTYSTTGDRAVVYRAVQRGGLNGNGALLVLEKVQNEWRLKYRFNVWYS
ncbi:hypothetical protein GKZ68_16665 [Hymenobacter sp. BRD128]|uniref:hypothetical protein n=1 Tax=Hymenobacter sp. BRD128 TaxID=2675878 RepID=UPI0015630E30|nr:hypothetical protein [Hymenobacter sp. BRD128]QKG58112.1 hypothetical protein GKZ68_16665 [Hymenobacter sp. BRD128]